MEYILKGLDIHHVSVTGEEIVNNSACGVVTQWCDHGNLRKGEMESLDVHHVSMTGEGIVNSGAYEVVAQWCDHRNLRKGGEKERSGHDMAQTTALIHPAGKTATLVMLLGSAGPWCASCWLEMMALLQSGSVDHE